VRWRERSIARCGDTQSISTGLSKADDIAARGPSIVVVTDGFTGATSAVKTAGGVRPKLFQRVFLEAALPSLRCPARIRIFVLAPQRTQKTPDAQRSAPLQRRDVSWGSGRGSRVKSQRLDRRFWFSPTRSGVAVDMKVNGFSGQDSRVELGAPQRARRLSRRPACVKRLTMSLPIPGPSACGRLFSPSASSTNHELAGRLDHHPMSGIRQRTGIGESAGSPAPGERTSDPRLSRSRAGADQCGL